MTLSIMTLTASIDGHDLDVVSGSITLDEGWSPFAQANITISAPAPEVAALLDPRLNKRVTLTATQSFGTDIDPTVAYYTELFGGWTLGEIGATLRTPSVSDLTARSSGWLNVYPQGDPITRTFDLALREKDLAQLADDVTLKLESDECYLNSVGLINDEPFTSSSESLRYICSETITLTAPGDEPFLPGVGDPAYPDNFVPADGHTWMPGVKGWDFLTPLLQAGNMRLWCDETRTWHLAFTDSIMAPGFVQLSHLDTIIDTHDKISLEALWYDAVVITYKWTVGGDAFTRYDFAQTVPSPINTLHIEYTDVFYPGAGAAARILARSQGKGKQRTVLAVNDFTVTPSMAIRLIIDSNTRQNGYVSSVTWNFPSDEMQISTRNITDETD